MSHRTMISLYLNTEDDIKDILFKYNEFFNTLIEFPVINTYADFSKAATSKFEILVIHIDAFPKGVPLKRLLREMLIECQDKYFILVCPENYHGMLNRDFDGEGFFNLKIVSFNKGLSKTLLSSPKK